MSCTTPPIWHCCKPFVNESAVYIWKHRPGIGPRLSCNHIDPIDSHCTFLTEIHIGDTVPYDMGPPEISHADHWPLLTHDYMLRIDASLLMYSGAIDLKRNIPIIKEAPKPVLYTSSATGKISSFTIDGEDFLYMFSGNWVLFLCGRLAVVWCYVNFVRSTHKNCFVVYSKVTTHYCRNLYSSKSYWCDERYTVDGVRFVAQSDIHWWNSTHSI